MARVTSTFRLNRLLQIAFSAFCIQRSTFASSQTHTMATANQGKIIINLAGDVMIGRLIDQLLPTSVHNPEEAATVRHFRSVRGSQFTHLQEGNYGYATVWGDTLPLWKEGNLNIINLETAVTTYEKLWPGKVFNYRTHPANLACLIAAHVHHVSLANNHTLDFDVKGLEETCESLDRSGISYVGAGKTRQRALGPVFLDVPISVSTSTEKAKPTTASAGTSRSSTSLRVGLLSASDHPSDWSSVPLFHLLPPYHLPSLRAQLAPLIASARANTDLVIFSVHWGPNYQWVPDKVIQELARWMIAEGVDIVHGHSSHHVQGVEIVERNDRTRGLIVYGCGDFVDDYATDEHYRNDLSALFRVQFSTSPSSSGDVTSKYVHLDSLSIFPTRCSNFQVNRLHPKDNDWTWVKDKLIQLSSVGGKTWTVGQNGEIRLDLSL